MARLVAVFALVAYTVTLAACANTARGVGRDVKNNGEATVKVVRGR